MSGSPEGAAVTVATQETTASTADVKSQVQAEDTKTTEAATEAETNNGQDQTDEGEQKPKKKGDGGFQRRINRLTADFRSAEQRAAQAEARARELESKLTTPAKSEDLKAPRLEDFKSYEEFEVAKETYVAEKTRRQTLKEWEDRQAAEKTKAEKTAEADRIKAARERFDDEAEKVSEHYEDFEDVMEDLNRGRTPLNRFDQDALEFIFEGSKRGPELVYHLHTNPTEADRIGGLRRAQQVAELARLEASLPKPGAKNVTKTPAPPKQLGGRGGSDGKDPEKMSIEEMRAATKTVKRVPD